MLKTVFWVTEVGQKDNDLVGKKCANLGEMAKLGLQVPPCFFVSIEACRSFMRETGVEKGIQRYIRELADPSNMGIKEIEKVSQDLRHMIQRKEMSNALKQQIASHYNILCDHVRERDVPVSVRSSGTESRPGMFATYFNVKGEDRLVEKIKEVWASAYTARAIAFRINKGIPIDSDTLGVGIVKMVNAKTAGVSFSVHPVTGDASKIMIEATWGLGEGVVKGTESVDRFIMDKQTRQVKKEIGRKEKQVVVSENGIVWEEVSLEKREIPSLSDDEINQVAHLTRVLEEKLGRPQDVEWAIEEGPSSTKNVYLLQTRPAKIAVSSPSSTSEKMCEDVTKAFRKIDVSKLRVPGADFKF
jgi:pyruvate,water dikinase